MQGPGEKLTPAGRQLRSAEFCLSLKPWIWLKYVLGSKHKAGSPSFNDFLLLSKEYLLCFLCIWPGMAVYQILIHFLSKSIHFLTKRNVVSYSQENINSRTSSGRHSNFCSLSIYPAGYICIYSRDSTALPLGATAAGPWACYSLKEAAAQILCINLYNCTNSARLLPIYSDQGCGPIFSSYLLRAEEQNSPLKLGGEVRKALNDSWPFQQVDITASLASKNHHSASDVVRCVNKAPLELQPLHHPLGHREFGKATARLACPHQHIQAIGKPSTKPLPKARLKLAPETGLLPKPFWQPRLNGEFRQSSKFIKNYNLY